MATHENLPSLFTDIANSIRGKTGDTASLIADNFPSIITSALMKYLPDYSGGTTITSNGTVNCANTVMRSNLTVNVQPEYHTIYITTLEHSSYTWVSYNGISYKSDYTSFQVSAGDKITLYVHSQTHDDRGRIGSDIYINGENTHFTSEGTHSVSYTPTTDCIIEGTYYEDIDDTDGTDNRSGDLYLNSGTPMGFGTSVIKSATASEGSGNYGIIELSLSQNPAIVFAYTPSDGANAPSFSIYIKDYSSIGLSNNSLRGVIGGSYSSYSTIASDATYSRGTLTMRTYSTRKTYTCLVIY